jgi:hypothetical protein
MKTTVKTLDTWTIEGSDGRGTPSQKRIELYQDSRNAYGVGLLIGGEVVDEEWFEGLFDAVGYADEMRRSVADADPDPAFDAIGSPYERSFPAILDSNACTACIEAIANAIGQGRAGDALRALRAAGLA